MFALEHRVRVFVFQVLDDEIQYLLLRRRPRHEWPLGPAIGRVGLDEHMREAVVREVREETGIHCPVNVLELDQPSKELFGADVGIVDWPFGYQAGTPAAPVDEIQPGPRVGEARWMAFENAFRSVENEIDRDVLVRLQIELGGAAPPPAA